MSDRIRAPRWTYAAAAALLFQAPQLSPHETGLVRFWLTCLDCGYTRDSIRAIGLRKPVSAVDSLAHALNNGPPPYVVASIDSGFNRAYTRDSLYRAKQGLPFVGQDRSQYRAEHVSRFINGIRARGATGLGVIHNQRAVAALNAALGPQVPASVRRAIIFARDSM